MRAPPFALALLLVAACRPQVDDTAVPSAEDIRELETKLSQHPCIGDLSQWERNYRFSRKTGLVSEYTLNPDFDVVEFHLRRAGTISIRPALNIMEPTPGGDWPDSNPIQSVDGRFTLTSGALTVSRCNPGRRG